jgi:peptide deformylase
MKQIMLSKNGMGLAAPQVGVSLRLVLVTIDGVIYPLINPDIHPIGTDMEIALEGCLSFPNEYVPVSRYKRIAVAYLNDKYKPTCLDLSGLNARCVQHEFDHLNGMCIT